VQPRLPLLIGGGGEKRTMRIAARYADEWNFWSTPDVLAGKVRVLHDHCRALGRDPTELRVSTQALLFMSTDPAWVDGHRTTAPGRAIVGTPSEVSEIVGRYRDAGADELIVPDTTLGPLVSAKETCDLFMAEVAAHLPGH
jgi:alkanesulfonate monooxygenase SsuD/methylene tetrahydromethanopterin reductase-like flavin-dependent oxidoreductase (luciferase family)